jgi:predicted alpha/beta superfamily hydrolase
VDQTYRTKKDRDNTGIGGSSLGALISIYSGFLYPEVYSKLLIFSPSLWVEPNNNFPMMSFRVPFKTKIYLYGGGQEGSKMVKRIHIFEEYLKRWEKKTFSILNSEQASIRKVHTANFTGHRNSRERLNGCL